MLKDHKLTPDDPEQDGNKDGFVRHTIGVIVTFLPGAALLLLAIGFGVGDDSARVIWITLAVCLAGSIMLASTSKVAYAYLLAFAPAPLMYLAAMLSSLPDTHKWTEDVLLDDGTTIQVKRKVKLKANGSEELDATISFAGDLEDLPPWRAPLMAIVLYQDKAQKEWVVVATMNFCSVWERNGKPQPPYWEYRLGPQGWRQVPLSEVSLGRRANLLHDTVKNIDGRHITVGDRNQLDRPKESLENMTYGSRKEWIVSNERYRC